MEKTKRAEAVKKLEKELKEEKHAEMKRRREVTMERKKAAEERERIEADKANVRSFFPLSCIGDIPLISFLPQMGARKTARMLRKAGRTKKINQ